MWSSESPGSIRNQIGRSLNVMRDYIDREDSLGLANHLRFLVALCAPKLPPDEIPNLKPPSIPKELSDDDADQMLFEACMERLEKLLVILAKEGLYAFMKSEAVEATGLEFEPEMEQ